MIRKPVTSSNLKSVGYDPGSAMLEIEFQDGSVYQYSGVPQNVHQALMAAASLGSFLHKHIKGKYSYHKVM
jgi:hypothetical protein